MSLKSHTPKRRPIKSYPSPIIYWIKLFFLLSFLPAQEIPDTIWGFAGSDTVSLAIHRLFGGGWSIRLFYKTATWQEVSRETLWIEETPRLLQWSQYCAPPFEQPCQHLTFTYLEGRLYATQYRYAAPIFVPKRRLYVWGTPMPASENLLFSAGANLLWPAAPDTLSPVWPFPREWKRTYWADSTLTEVFDSTYQVFVEVGGFKRSSGSGSCDSIYRYEGAYFFPAAVGRGSLCFPDGQKLTFAYDSLCDADACQSLERLLGYAGDKPTADTLRVRLYTRAGQLLTTTQLITQYQYDSNGRLLEVHSPYRRYRLSYSGQALALAYAHSKAPTIQYSSTEKWVHLHNLYQSAQIYLYDLTGRLIFLIEASTDGLYKLPEELHGPYVMKVQTSSTLLGQKVIFLP